MIFLAILMTSIAALSGIFAVGSGRHWQFEVRDYFRGKRNAILYLWVVTSTIFSICHSGFLVDYGIANFGQPRPGDVKWMVIHSVAGFLLTCAHAFVASTLAKEVGPTDKFLWGKRRHANS
ncbi:hypothetical protein ACQKOE_07685 [Novosphingobium sp. NPDC080210]|uniref:hypothetical protein n=1 Tax=Novosphingobium sp. NPDC080210 TaxID=3390596 RepID=UPI003CFFEEDF